MIVMYRDPKYHTPTHFREVFLKLRTKRPKEEKKRDRRKEIYEKKDNKRGWDLRNTIEAS